MSPKGMGTVKLDELYEGAKQDLADGRALRLLREALPEGWTFEVCPARTLGDVVVEVWERDAPLNGANGVATTIAEAADKCREALR